MCSPPLCECWEKDGTLFGGKGVGSEEGSETSLDFAMGLWCPYITWEPGPFPRLPVEEGTGSGWQNRVNVLANLVEFLCGPQKLSNF
jgi:hypothetical protein